MERIKRNQQYLAKLGLEGTDGQGVLGKNLPSKKTTRRRRKSNETAPSERRSSLSRRSKQEVTYTEKPASWWKKEVLANEGTKEDKDRASKPKKDRKKERPPSQRMDKAIYMEFKRIHSHRKQALKQAKKHVRVAEREFKHWSREATAFQRAEQRRIEVENLLKFAQEEKKIIGCTAMELIQDIDVRSGEMYRVLFQYEDAKRVSCVGLRCHNSCFASAHPKNAHPMP